MRISAFLAAGAALVWTGAAAAQNTSAEVAPVIDVHMHAMEDASWAVPVCPNQARFEASDPKNGPEAPFGWSMEECSPKLYPAPKGQYMKMVLAEMERLNVRGVVFGEPDAVKKWQTAAPARVIPGTAFGRVAGSDPAKQLKMLEVAFGQDGRAHERRRLRRVAAWLLVDGEQQRGARRRRGRRVAPRWRATR